MKQEDKELLLQDLCSRLPYGVKLLVPSWDEREMEYIDRVDVLYSVNGDEYIKSTNEDYDFRIEDIKPYLFPLSSMTDEQMDEYDNLRQDIWDKLKDWKCAKLLDWLNENHFDYRGLIEKSLALDATGLNIY